MLSLSPELADPVARLRVKLAEINDSERICMADAAASVSQGRSCPEAQAIMARCRQTSAAAATTALDTFRNTCSKLGAHTTSPTVAAVLAATATNVSNFCVRSESLAAASASETAAQLPARGPDMTTQVIENTYRERELSINRYFEQLTTEQLTPEQA